MLRKNLNRLEQPIQLLEEEEEIELHVKEDHVLSTEPPVSDNEIHGMEDEKAGSFSPQPCCSGSNVGCSGTGKTQGGSGTIETLFISNKHVSNDESEKAVDPGEDRVILERKRQAVLEEQRRIQEVLASRPPPLEDDFELKAKKAMRAMEEGDACMCILTSSATDIAGDITMYYTRSHVHKCMQVWLGQRL
ncbi:hypothetical protein Dimus_019016 [Dionaea muscipula]